MKRHIAWIALIVFGVLLIIGNLVYPFITMAITAESEPLEEPIAIIGGADEPTAMFVYSLLLNRRCIALIAMGVLSLLAGIIVCISTCKRIRETKQLS